MTDQLRAARIAFWSNKPTWTVRDFAFLHRGYEPTDLSKLYGIKIADFIASLDDWAEWSPGCPGISSLEKYPFETQVPKEPMIRWAMNLRGIEIPAWMAELVGQEDEPQPTQPVQEANDIGKGERLTLLRIIGGLAAALVEAKDRSDSGLKSNSGTPKEPNISGLTRLCQKHTGNKKKGMSKSNMDSLISEGLRTLRK